MKKNDYILIGALLILSCLLFFVPITSDNTGTKINIIVDDVCKYSLPLSEDRKITVKGKDDKGINVVVIENNKVFVEKADCKDKLCINQGQKCMDGEVIVCLPHKVIIKVVDE